MDELPDEAGDRIAPRAPRGWPAELAVAVAALVLNAWALSQNGLGNSYYAAAVRSMTLTWKNFVFGSYDAGGFITPDKPPFALWVQAASARIFGYGSWSLLLPSVVAGALAVWLLMVTVRRVWGRTAGVVAGVALALTPMMFAVSRSSNPDAILVLMIVAGAWATERAIATDRYRWSALAGLFVGLGFLTKMLAAFVVVPALGIALLVAIRSWRRALVHGTVLSGAIVGVSLAWIGLMDLTSSSPYVGGSEDGSAWNLVFGYNGFGRVVGNGGPGGGGAPGGARPGGGFGGLGGSVIDQFGGTPGMWRLFNNGMGDQVMWLVIPAVVALVGGLAIAVRRRRRDAELGSLLVFGLWALTGDVLFAFSEGIFHNYYVSAIAPPLAALVGVGASLVLRGGRTTRSIAAASMVATTVLQLAFVRRVDAVHWTRVVVPVALVLAAVVLLVWAWVPAVARGLAGGRRYLLVTAGVMAATLVAPAVWVHAGLTSAQSASFPDARPGSSTGGFGFGGPGGGVGGPGAGGGFGGGGLDASTLSWLESHRDGATWIVAVQSSMEADQAIIDGHAVMAMGGFRGSDPAMTPSRLAELVRAGELRYVLTSGGRGPGGGSSQVSAVVAAACTPVDDPAVTASISDCSGAADAIERAAASTPTTGTQQPGGQLPGGQFPGGQFPGGQGGPPGNGPGGFDPAQMIACLQEQGIDPSQVAGGLPAPGADIDPAILDALQACLGAP